MRDKAERWMVFVGDLALSLTLLFASLLILALATAGLIWALGLVWGII